MSARPDQCWLTSGWWYLNCDSCLMYECVRTVYQSSHIWTWKESEADRSLMDVRTGCWEVQTDASWNRSFSIQWRVRTERYVVRMDDAGLSGVRTGWHIVWTNGTVDRWASGRDNTSFEWLTGNLKSSIFFAVQSLLKMLWQVESMFIASLHISDFVQTQNEAKILTILFIVFGVWEIGVVMCLWILGSVLQIVLEHIVLGRGYTILGVTQAKGSLFESMTRLLKPGTYICIHILWCVWVCYFHDMYIVVLLGGLVCIWVLMEKNICTWMYMGILVVRI
jgi:hypothetical protein